jgi:hypothetical protein
LARRERLDWLIVRKIDRSALADDGELLGTHIEIDEINPRADGDRRARLIGCSGQEVGIEGRLINVLVRDAGARSPISTVWWRLPCGRY